MEEICSRHFANGSVYALKTRDGFPIETTDTFLPFYTKDSVGRHQNSLQDYHLGDRSERWMIGVSCMSGCPVRCKFCATGKLKKIKLLSAEEILEQVKFITEKNSDYHPDNSQEFKINMTRMGEPFLNLKEVRRACDLLTERYPKVHIYLSTVGITGSDFSWIKDNITLQNSVHSLDEERRNNLIPYGRKMSLKELGQIRTRSNLKTTVNMTLVDWSDFDIVRLKEYFDPEYFFIKLSPVNVNDVSLENKIGRGVVEGLNLI